MKKSFVSAGLAIVLLGISPCSLMSQSDAKPQSTEKADRARIDIGIISIQLKTYRVKTGAFPSNSEGLAALAARPASNPPNWLPLMEATPLDPWDHPYQYKLDETGSITIFSWGENAADSADDIRITYDKL